MSFRESAVAGTGTRTVSPLVSDSMFATLLATTALAVAPVHAHPCRTALPQGPAVPAPIVLWTSCGSFRLAPGGRVSRLPRHWLAKHGSGTGRRYGAHLDIRRTHAGRFLLLLHGRTVWRSAHLYPRDGGAVAFGPHSFAFASYRHGVFLTDLQGAERLVAHGRGLFPYSFTSSGELIVTGGPTIALVSPAGSLLRRFRYRVRNGYAFDEKTDTLYYVTPAGRLAAERGTHVDLKRTVTHLDGTLTVARANLLVFSGSRSITVTRRDGAVVARATWRSSELTSDAGVSVSSDGSSFAFRLSDAHPGTRSSSAAVYLLRAGARRAQPVYRQRLGPTGCASGANLTWQGSSLLYGSSDGTLAVIDTRTGAVTDLTALGGPFHIVPGPSGPTPSGAARSGRDPKPRRGFTSGLPRQGNNSSLFLFVEPLAHSVFFVYPPLRIRSCKPC